MRPFAAGTSLLTPDGAKPIEEFELEIQYSLAPSTTPMVRCSPSESEPFSTLIRRCSSLASEGRP